MNSYENVPPANSRRRRTEHFADTYQADAPTNIPHGTQMEEAAYQAPAAGTPVEEVKKDASVQAGTVQHTSPQPLAGYPQGTRQPQSYQQPMPSGRGWSQAYPVQQPQPASNRGWQYAYDPQQQITQNGQRPQTANPGWSQAYEVQQQGRQDWSQPYPVQNTPPVQQQTYYGNQTMWQSTYTPQPVQEAKQKPLKSGGGEPPQKQGWWKLALIAAAVVLVVVAAVIGGTSAVSSGRLREEVTAYDSRYCQNVYVDGIHLGGMTMEEAFHTVSQNAQARRNSFDISLTIEGLRAATINADTIGLTVNVNDALEEAWAQGHSSSSISERKAAMDQLMETPYYGYTAMPGGNTNSIDTILSDIANRLYIAPQDAYMRGFDPGLTNPLPIEPEVYGQRLDTTEVRKLLYSMVENMQSGAIALDDAIVPVTPQVTAADLQNKYTLRGRSVTLISTTSKEGRNKNIQRALELINGTVLKPGEKFSFNEVVGARTQKNGFYLAIEYAYGNEREGYGGGVCQVSSTIYIAAVKANMEIVKREPHSDKVNYTEYGLDATVNYDGKKIDFVFKNDTASDVYIKARVEYDPKVDKDHKYVLIELYGESLGEGVSYDLKAETVEILPAPVEVEYIKDKDGTHVTYVDQEEQKRPASEGYVVDSFKVKYVNGEEVERIYMYRDTYKAKTQQIWVGVTDREAGYWENGGY